MVKIKSIIANVINDFFKLNLALLTKSTKNMFNNSIIKIRTAFMGMLCKEPL